MNINDIIDFLKNYDEEDIYLMEVCGTHTASISENGIPSLISPKIHLISGPGCPVCVTASSYIDKLLEISKSNTVVTFGDMIRVPGSENSLYNAKSSGANVQMVYSPFELLDMAEQSPNTNFVFASVGFETTTPIYALLIDKMIERNIKNVKLLTALKTMPMAIKNIAEKENKINGFIAPGHVATITGAKEFETLAKELNLPFVVSGFEAEELLSTIFALVKLKGTNRMLNLYKSAVSYERNEKAHTIVSKYFEPCDAAWRGLGIIKNSGMRIKEKYSQFDYGSVGLIDDKKFNSACCCGEIIAGLKNPNQCPLFSKVCTPDSPKGACMVSNEGSCFHYFINKRS